LVGAVRRRITGRPFSAASFTGSWIRGPHWAHAQCVSLALSPPQIPLPTAVAKSHAA
jgi:hypothetical protein